MLTEINQLTENISQLRSSPEWAFKDVERSETNYITHGYHRYPAKFIPNIVQKLITKYTKPGDVIVDTFGGCGTTLVEAKISGRKSFGFDINPVSKLITQAKITPLSKRVLAKAEKQFLLSYHNNHPHKCHIDIENTKLLYWFDKQTIAELNKIYSSIKTIKNSKAKNFYFCAFSHILKNSSRWLMKSIKPTIDKDKVIPHPFNIFTKHIYFMTKRNNQFYEKLVNNKCLQIPTKMYLADSTKKLSLQGNSVDLVITSPPYVTSYEYADLHQLSLFWFGNDKKDFKQWHHYLEEFNIFRKKFIGTTLRKTQKKEVFNSFLAENITNKLSFINKSLARSVAHYFSDMNKSFIEIFRFLKLGGKACIIIGNTTLNNVEITNAEVAIEQMQNIGFLPVEFIKREITNKMITPWRDKIDGRFTGLDNPNKKRVYQYEYILVMEKPTNEITY